MSTAVRDGLIEPRQDEPVWTVQAGGEVLDFRRWCFVGGKPVGDVVVGTSAIDAGRQQLVLTLRDAVSRLTRTLSAHTIRTLCRCGMPSWFEFLDGLAAQGRRVSRVGDITKDLLESYVSWLRHKPAETKTGMLSYGSARAIYSYANSILLECVAAGVLSRDCLLVNPFPNSNRAHKGHQPFSAGEMHQILAALASDLTAIRAGGFKGTESERLLVYLLIFAAKTGRNPAPLLELTRDALQPHPLRPDSHALLRTYKRRGNNIAVQSFRCSRTIEDAATISADVATLFYEVRTMTEKYVADASAAHRRLLWLCRRESHNSFHGMTAPLNSDMVHDSIKRFVERHQLVSDDIDSETGERLPLRVTIMRFRKTFATRMWWLTGADLVRTANALGNQPRMADSHYLAVTPEMERNHKFVGLCLETHLRGLEEDAETLATLAREMRVSVDDVRRVLSGKHNTGVGRCSSPLYGKFAPKTGERACTAFLACFRCPNQVVMESDLHRLFSFYWLLIKERNVLVRNRWRQVYGWVIREVDQVIAKRFPADVVRAAREGARLNPHPMWRERTILGAVANE